MSALSLRWVTRLTSRDTDGNRYGFRNVKTSVENSAIERGHIIVVVTFIAAYDEN